MTFIGPGVTPGSNAPAKSSSSVPIVQMVGLFLQGYDATGSFAWGIQDQVPMRYDSTLNEQFIKHSGMVLGTTASGTWRPQIYFELGESGGDSVTFELDLLQVNFRVIGSPLDYMIVDAPAVLIGPEPGGTFLEATWAAAPLASSGGTFTYNGPGMIPSPVTASPGAGVQIAISYLLLGHQ